MVAWTGGNIGYADKWQIYEHILNNEPVEFWSTGPGV